MSNLFDVELSVLAQSLVDSHLCSARKGSLILQYNDHGLAISLAPPCDDLVKDLISFCNSYLTDIRCLSRRSKEMLSRQSELRKSLSFSKKQTKVLGCYPLYDDFLTLEESNANGSSLSLLKLLENTLGESKMFLSKQAKELIAVNVCEMSGNSSMTPHTVLV